MTKAQKAERQEAIEQLRGWIKPGDTVYTILDHVSTSGMSRAIRVVVPMIHAKNNATLDQNSPIDRYAVDFRHPNYAIGKALDLRHWKRNGREQDALVMGGCGMDMGFALVYNLSHALYGAGYACLGKGKCPSNYHNNHRDRLRCEGTTVYNPDGPNTGKACYKPRMGFARHEDVPQDWPILQIPIGETGETVDFPASCITDDNGENPQACPTCAGAGDVPNPEGPERFDLTHTDGYALRHRWL